MPYGKNLLNWPHNLHNTSWYSIFSKRVEGKRRSNSGNSVLIVEERDDEPGGMVGMSTAFGRRQWWEATRITAAEMHGHDGKGHVPMWTRYGTGRLPTVTTPKEGGYPDYVEKNPKSTGGMWGDISQQAKWTKMPLSRGGHSTCDHL